MKNFPYPKEKYWRKKKAEDILKGLIENYEELSKLTKIQYSDETFQFIPRLETDVEDDWIGVEPKRFVKSEYLVKNWNLILLSLCLSNDLYGNHYIRSNFFDDEDDGQNKINWDLFVKENKELLISPLFNYKKVSFNSDDVLSIHKILIDNIDYIRYLNESFKKNEEITTDKIEKLLNNINYEKYSRFLPKELVWKHKFNFVPRNKNIKELIDPFIFNKKTWDSALSILEKKKIDIKKLEMHICQIYNTFNGKVSNLFNQIKNDTIFKHNFSNVNYIIDEMEFLKLFKSNNNISQNLALIEIINNEKLKIEIDTYQKTKNLIMKDFYEKHGIRKDFITKTVEYIESVSKNIEDVYTNVGVIKRYQSYFDDTRNDKCDFPNLKGEDQSGKSIYSWEISTKDNPENVILGNATDCCQTLDGQGKSCLKYGLSKKNSTFFIVKRNSKIIAQSWMWINKDTKVICFDSIEILGNDAYSDKVIDYYLEVSEELKKTHGFKTYKIIAGADGNRMPENINKLGTYISENNGDDLFKLPPDYNSYSDAVEEQYIIKK